MTRITVPFLDANILDVTVVKWRKARGEAIAAGEVAVEVSTDKAAFEIEAPASGTLLDIFAPEKSIVPVKYVLGLIGQEGEADPSAAADNAALMASYRSALAAPPAVAPKPATSATPAAPSSSGPALRATPKARRYAQSKGIDLADVARATGATMITEALIAQYEEGLKK